MADDWERMYVLPLNDVDADRARVGGKGASLARLAAAGLPVPAGFHVTTGAYRRFVDGAGLRDPILEAVAGCEPEEAARRIAELFAGPDLPAEVAGPIRWAYADLGEQDAPVAVRSSATAEDLPHLSFAGQQDSFLGVRGEAALLAAVRRCWASLWTARAIDYRTRNGVDHADVALAVVVQTMVPADAAGVLFTVAPVSGAADQVVINAVWGLGEAVASGQATPDVLVLDKQSGKMIGQRIADKPVRVAAGGGTEPVAAELRTRPALRPEQAAELVRLGVRIEELYRRPMDVEWALRDGFPYILQARPITVAADTGPGDPWNDSLGGDDLWTSGNLGEAIPDVMTPCTWSLVQIFMDATMATSSVPPFRAYGNIGGRFYMNLSVAAGLATAFGMKSRLGMLEQVFGKLPPGVTIPSAPLSRWAVLRSLAPVAASALGRIVVNQRRLPDFLASSPGRCDALHDRIRRTSDPKELAELWRKVLSPFLVESCRMLEAAGREGGGALVTVRAGLEKLVGEPDAGAMLTGLRVPDGAPLAALGPVTGLARLARGDLDRATYLREWGHRSPHEFEVSMPRPAEDPDWIDRQLLAVGEAGHDATDLQERQRAASRDAWRRFREQHPRKVAATRRRAARWARAAHDREAARSEVIRVFWVLRSFVLRAGELTGHGGDLFFLTIDEVANVLGGSAHPLEHVAARRRAYQRYRTLPTYPALIRGPFDPFAWAAEPDRRTDYYDATARPGAVETGDTITGFAGSAGRVEGVVRVLHAPEDGAALRPGEILVTTVTNIGWTPLFPRAAAVVTDVGAPLSHAAIVARELGIPAVVGTGDATMRLHTGDRVRVDGGQGVVRLLSRAGRNPAEPQPTTAD